MIVHKLSLDVWRSLAPEASLVVFGTRRPAEIDRIDYALMIERKDTGKPAGYATVQELGEGVAHIQFAGAFPETRATLHTVRGLMVGLTFLKEQYTAVNCRVENTNTPMLRLAMRVGFKIVGVRMHEGRVLLDHTLEFCNAP